MSRPIKFMAWDKENKEWIKYDEITISLNGQVANNIDLYQFTGLLDKDGKEIYEGHRVKVELPRGDTIKGTIVFDEGCFRVNFDEGWDNNLGTLLDMCSLKIIGHIAEEGKDG